MRSAADPRGISVVAEVVEKPKLDQYLRDAIQPGLARAVNIASEAGAAEATEIIVSSGRVKTGRMRDSNYIEEATESGGVAVGAFANRAPYAIFQEFGTSRFSGIYFMQRASKIAMKKLNEEINKLIKGAQR